MEAIDWAIEQDVDIINISFGTMTDSEEMHAAIQRAYNHGILIVAAAGNNGVVEYLAAYDEVIAVGVLGKDRTVSADFIRSLLVEFEDVAYVEESW